MLITLNGNTGTTTPTYGGAVADSHRMINMWKHYCVAESGYVMVKKNCMCNWCDKREK
jgi:hypothetical protein